MTSKLQLTLPKAVAVQYGIEPGAELDVVPAGDVIRLVPVRRTRPTETVEARLRRFDAATKRIRARSGTHSAAEGTERDWTRDDLYDRARAR